MLSVQKTLLLENVGSHSEWTVRPFCFLPSARLFYLPDKRVGTSLPMAISSPVAFFSIFIDANFRLSVDRPPNVQSFAANFRNLILLSPDFPSEYILM